MPRRLRGFNATFTIRRRQRAVTSSGSINEANSVTIATGVPGTIQPHVLSNLPPPGQQAMQGGLLRKDEYRLWLGDTVNSGVDVRLDDLIEEEGTSPLRVFRVLAILDEAGRGHHQYMRVESYSQESGPWVNRGGEPAPV